MSYDLSWSEKRLLLWNIPAVISALIAAWCVFTSELEWSLVWEWPLLVAMCVMSISMMLFLVDLDGDTPILDRLRLVCTHRIYAPFFGSISFAWLWNVFAQGFAFWKIQTTLPPPVIRQITSLDSKFLHDPVWGDLSWWASDAFMKSPIIYAVFGIVALHVGYNRLYNYQR